MSKERLEEIIQDLPYSTRYMEEVRELTDYAREQAGRVQEWESIARTQHDAKLEIESHCLELDAQNKRYRETIEKIKESPRKAHSGSDCVDIIFEIIKELESEEG